MASTLFEAVLDGVSEERAVNKLVKDDKLGGCGATGLGIAGVVEDVKRLAKAASDCKLAALLAEFNDDSEDKADNSLLGDIFTG